MAAEVAVKQALHLPKPGMRASGLPSPVLKLAWQRRQTYIFELDIIGFTPGWLAGRAAVYSAWVWRSFSGSSAAGTGEEERRVAMLCTLGLGKARACLGIGRLAIP